MANRFYIYFDFVISLNELEKSKIDCFYTFGRIDWVGWRLVGGEHGRGWTLGRSHVGYPTFIIQDGVW